MAKTITLVLGGVRSGKSLFAEDLAHDSGKEVLYLATAKCKDEEMAQRIEMHRKRRPEDWITVEEPGDIPSRLASTSVHQIILVDCLTGYLTNHLLQLVPDWEKVDNWADIEKSMSKIIDELVIACCSSASSIVIVSNEVGLGLVPPYVLGRVFRDLAGLANQQVGKVADQVFLVAAGIPVEIKSLAYKHPENYKKEKIKQNFIE